MRRTRLLVRVTGLGEAQADGLAAVIAVVLLALAGGALAQWM
jgi:hypothetical protein